MSRVGNSAGDPAGVNQASTPIEVNNAGIALNGPFLEQTPENFATTMSVNVTLPALLQIVCCYRQRNIIFVNPQRNSANQNICFVCGG